ncbi:hypothetical protein [Paenibacillus physcomitrellae]|uniref:2TM domain-containing protein n=1 Tax=Paenibacillus physcomitrellae TaxID=1619311 RepID=A0ABQ1GY88_9BACL|nr:hypothetical protein [Paenibacillus physcomitrellae]GGA52714.1 hypothetical protein GCM10010917_42430 [Paenibacillus physcomitrellae]
MTIWGKVKHILYMLVALAMLLYALPMISFAPGSGWVSWFGAVWALFAFLVIGAHLHFILGVDTENKKQLEWIRQAKLREWQLKWSKDRKQSRTL